MAKRIAILSVAVVCIFIAYVFVPKREFFISVFPLHTNENVLVYDDVADGGNSVSKMTVSDSSLDFECSRRGRVQEGVVRNHLELYGEFDGKKMAL